MPAVTELPPVIAPAQHARRKFRVRGGYIVLALILLVPAAGAFGITGYFRLSSETQALRGSLMNSVPGEWHKKFAVHAGYITMALVRNLSHHFRMPAEPRAAIEALRGAEVGVYELQGEPIAAEPGQVLQASDKALRARGWERFVGVVQGEQLVAIYLPRKGLSSSHISCCLMVLHERQLVVASVRGNAEPLLELANKKLEASQPWKHFDNEVARLSGVALRKLGR